MNIKIDSNFQFSVASIQYTATGELSICLTSDEFHTDIHYQYSASLGNGQAEERPSVSLLQYAKAYAASANIKPKTKESYMHVCRHLADYGDSTMDKVTTNYLQSFILHLQSQGMKPGSVRLILPETGLRPPRCLQERTLRRPHPATGETSQTRTGEEELSDRNGIEETDQPQAFRRVQQHPVDVPLFLHDRTALQRRTGSAMEGREAQRQAPSAGVPPAEDRHL